MGKLLLLGGGELNYNLAQAFLPGESCLMQDEPEAEIGFSYKMSLKERSRMLGIENQHAGWRAPEPGTDPGVSGSQ